MPSDPIPPKTLAEIRARRTITDRMRRQIEAEKAELRTWAEDLHRHDPQLPARQAEFAGWDRLAGEGLIDEGRRTRHA